MEYLENFIMWWIKKKGIENIYIDVVFYKQDLKL